MTVRDDRGFQDLRVLLDPHGRAVMAVVVAMFVATGVLFPMLPLYLDLLGASGTVVGVSLAVYGVGEGVFAFTWGSVVDRLGNRGPLGVLSFGTAACLVGLALIPHVSAILVVRFALGALGAAIWPAGRGYFLQTVDVRSKGVAAAAFAILVAGSMSVGSFFSGALSEIIGYRGVFLSLAVLMCLAGLYATPLLKEIRPVHGSTGLNAPLTAIREIPLGPVLTLSAIVVFLAGAYGCILNFLPLLMRHVGLPASRVGVVFGVGTATSLFFVLSSGRFSDRVGRRQTMALGLIALVLSISLLVFARTYPVIVVAAVAMFVSRWVVDPPLVSLLSDVMPRTFQGRAQGIHVAAFDVGLILGPTAAGVLWDHFGPAATFGFAASLAGAALLFAALLVREHAWRKDNALKLR